MLYIYGLIKNSDLRISFPMFVFGKFDLIALETANQKKYQE